MTDDAETPETKLTASKRRWAEQGKFLTGKVSRADNERLPPGQHLVTTWPVLDLGQQPLVRTETWRLDIDGAAENKVSLNWQAFQDLPKSSKLSDMHCVTTWSRYDNRWEGVSTHDLLDHVMPRDEAAFVLLTSSDGYTTNLPLADFASEDAILATHWEGAPLTREHGGPLRLIVPHLYLWKSAKWLNRITLMTQDEAGFWERNGYHMRGDPWTEERYSDD
ncbi:sulfite oxidase-like oxidoreductase [Pararhizobium sp.]|uniref:sulfite oxidase-like oxidoreductase n=1 Tax=Pararhizobium sp. TaxID=1977563 RepID=UPI0027187FB1|nr:sulfite oxidase-like oxidoreductase [Pararhizobium sp.]MDO9416298.1 sulfite oxidase-like oxidoreductase [Pararhizobium sp.]